MRGPTGYTLLPGERQPSPQPLLLSTSPLNSATACRPPAAHMGRCSPVHDRRRSCSGAQDWRLPAQRPGTPSAQPQQGGPLRSRQRLVLLPGEAATLKQPGADGRVPERAGSPRLPPWPVPQPSEDLFERTDAGPTPPQGRLTVLCIAEALDRKALDHVLTARFPSAPKHRYADVTHLELAEEGAPRTCYGAATGQKHGAAALAAARPHADVFFFDYGVMCFWGLSHVQEQELVAGVARKVELHPLPTADVEIDQYHFVYSAHEPPSMQNDVITINANQAGDHRMKLAICHALAQSTKLSVYEGRVLRTVLTTKHLPEQLAAHGTVEVSAKRVAQLIGQVYLQRSAVNLLSTVLDTPEFFWSAPDQLQALYQRTCEYLELQTRVAVLNARFMVLQEMLDMLREHQNHGHNARLEWIIIFLIGVELAVGVAQLCGMMGVLGAHAP